MFWVILIIIAILVFVGFKTTYPPPPPPRSGGYTGRESAKRRIASWEKANHNLDYREMGEICDSILDDISYLLTAADCYAYRQVIQDACLMYSGTRYPGRKDTLLEDLVAEKVNERLDQIYKLR